MTNLFLTKEPKTCSVAKTASLTNVMEETAYLHVEDYNSIPVLISTQWIKDLTIKSETLNKLKEIIANTLEHVDIGKNFLNRIPEAQQ
jgi:hypothetical protein